MSEEASRYADRGLLPPGQRFVGGALDLFLRGQPQCPIRHRGPRLPGRGFLELFGGWERLTGAVGEYCRTGVPIDSINGPAFDVPDPRCQRLVLDWIRTGAMWCLWIAQPCAFNSQASRCGKQLSEAAQTHSKLVHFLRRLIRACAQYRVFFVIENPEFSKLWSYQCARRALASARAARVRYKRCGFGAAFLKPQLLAGTLPGLSSVSRDCPCRARGAPHEVLQGKALLPGKRVAAKMGVGNEARWEVLGGVRPDHR